MGSVQLRSVAKNFGTVQVLFNINLDIAPGEFVVLVGPSGCGKSTLLRMIAGLEDLTAGDLLIDNVRANDVPPGKRDIAMVFQSYALFPHYTVRENMAFGPKLRGEPLARIAKKIDNAARMLDLVNELDRRPAHLSGGQRQRVAMGRAIVREPSLFLFDEPLSNLDAKLRVSMRTEIKAIHQKLGNTIIYVTHDQVEAMTMADRIVVMNAGRIEQQGSPTALYDRPANTFVAGFLGSPSMNFIEGVYDGQGSVTAASGLRLPAPSGLPFAGETVIAGVRPEHFEVVPRDQSANAAMVNIIEPTGQDTLLHVDAGGTPLTVSVRRRLAVRPGETIGLSALASELHLFSRRDGQRLDGLPEAPAGR
jgi:multiple sugar transport system ATP-binding protein